MAGLSKVSIGTAAVLAWLLAGGPGLAQTSPDPMGQAFAAPPDSAKPRTWWHWTGGNVTREGITKDLEWMRRVGIGGMQLADVSSGAGQTVEPKVAWGSPQWLDLVRHAASEADRLGLEMSLFSSAGWSETGGPWVRPEQAMKKLVWSETAVDGPTAFDGKLAAPPSANGPFGGLTRGGGGGDPTFYEDSAVVAFRTPPDESALGDLRPVVSASSADFDGTPLTDGDLNTSAAVDAPADGGPAWVQYTYPRPVTARAFTLVAPGRGVPFGRILAGDDGVHFRPLVDLPGPTQYRAGVVRTYALPAAVTARMFRVEMTAAALEPAGVMNQTPPQRAKRYALSEFTVHTAARVDHWQEKAAFNFLYDYRSVATPPAPPSSTVADVIDLTGKMDRDGTLHWAAPAGRWTVLRMGCSLTGAKNRPAPEAGLGFEVDKLNRRHVEAYFQGYTDPIFAKLGPLVGRSLRYLTMDSFEGGMQNWTDDMLDQFQRRRGYDPRPYLPVLTGRVVGSAQTSDQFLWDFRRTIADLMAECHYGTMADQAGKHGLGVYAEANGVSMEFMEDTLLDKSEVEIPMAELWVRPLHPAIQYYVDVRGAASAAHAYGKRLVAAESFTGGGYESPLTLKRISDYWLTQGVNRIVFHTSAHQPLDTKPGNTMVGTHLNRNITWAEQAGPFMTYLSRNMALLQRGLAVADLAYLLPEGAPSSQSFWGAGLQPTPPAGYDYDCVNADVLLHRMAVGADGRLVMPDGMSYRVLVLPPTGQMTLPVLRKVRDLVAGGATVIGPRPTGSPSLSPSPDDDWAALTSEVWGDLDGVMRNERYVGKGRVVWGLPVVDVLTSLGLPPDVETAHNLDGPAPWIHRRDGDADIYFLVSSSDRPQVVEARFRVDGKEPELWHSDTGATEPADYATADGRTTVPLHLAPRESVFVVFRKPTTTPSRTSPPEAPTTLATVDGGWAVTFPPQLGAPPSIRMDRLASWTAGSDPGVKYFSGTATYAKTVSVDPGWLKPGVRVWLDLGTVRDVAEVTVNGKAAGVLWKPPFAADVTDAVRPGDNQLQVRVTDEWTNRLIGDGIVPADQRVFPMTGGGRRPVARSGPAAIPAAGRGGGELIAPVPPAAESLPESGLLGPVVLVAHGGG